MTVSYSLEPIVSEDGLDGPFIVAGDQTYLIGCQDGSFPDMGWHVKGEMGGVWAHPIKLLDGFWLRASDTWLTEAQRFRIGPSWAEHEYELEGLRVVRHEFVPDGEPAIVVRYTFMASTTGTIPVRFLARTDLRDVWSPAPQESQEAPDAASYLEEMDAWSCRNEAADWRVVLGARGVQPVGCAVGRELWGPEMTAGQGITVALDYELPLTAGGTAALEIVITGSDRGSTPTIASYRRVVENLPELRIAKDGRYREMLEQVVLQIPDPSIMRAWDWMKCNFDWLVRAVQPWGRGLGAGVADYPWWFGCDNGYALRGCLALGQHDIALDTLDLLRHVSQAANGSSGRVIHESNTRGVATDLGRTEETPHFIRAVWDTFLWTGDMSFLERNYDFCKRGLLDWALGVQAPDGDVLPYGYGVMEMLGLNVQCIDTASLTVEALMSLAGMAEAMGESDVADRCRQLATTGRSRMDDAFWMEGEGLYGDMVATPAEMTPRLRHWLKESEEGSAAAESFRVLLEEAELDRTQDRKRPWLLKNWSVLCPLEGGLAASDRAARALQRVEGPEFTGPAGMYVCGTYRTAMMSIGTGVMAAAEAEYDRPEQALRYIRMLTDTLEMQTPGAIAEMSPDYGCFVQAWSGYAVAWPVVAGIFGVRPDAPRRRIDLTPAFPSGWTDARLSNMPVGTNRIDLRWDGTTLWVTSRESGWDFKCDRVPMRLESNSGSPGAD